MIELSIVMVIIALVLAGIVQGRAMIRASHIQAMLGEYDTYVKAIQEFQDKYHALPGDMKGTSGFTPQDMWGTDPGGCPAATNTVTKVATCNGDGNGHIGDSDTSGNMSNTAEWFRAWQHLADAKLINGSFTGVNTAGSATEGTPGVNIPQSALSGGAWMLVYQLQLAADTKQWGSTNYGHELLFGSFQSGGMAINPILTPAEALSIDLQIDDGMPGTGKVMDRRTGGQEPNCTDNNATAAAAVYNIAYKNTACSPMFLLGF